MPTPPLEPLMAQLRERHERTQADRILAERLEAAFEAPDAPDVGGLSFYVFDGAVSVYGPVASAALRDEILTRLTRIPGIRQITEQLTVGPEVSGLQHPSGAGRS